MKDFVIVYDIQRTKTEIHIISTCSLNLITNYMYYPFNITNENGHKFPCKIIHVLIFIHLRQTETSKARKFLSSSLVTAFHNFCPVTIRANVQRGTNTPGRGHYLTNWKNQQLAIKIKGKITGPWNIGHWLAYTLWSQSLCHTDPLSQI